MEGDTPSIWRRVGRYTNEKSEIRKCRSLKIIAFHYSQNSTIIAIVRVGICRWALSNQSKVRAILIFEKVFRIIFRKENLRGVYETWR